MPSIVTVGTRRSLFIFRLQRAAEQMRGADAAFLLPRGEKDRLRGFGSRDFSPTSEPPHPNPLPSGERECSALASRSLLVSQRQPLICRPARASAISAVNASSAALAVFTYVSVLASIHF